MSRSRAIRLRNNIAETGGHGKTPHDLSYVSIDNLSPFAKIGTCLEMSLSTLTVVNPLLTLQRDDIHVWFAFLDETTDEELLAAYRLMLNAEECAQERRFYFAKDRHRYLVTRALVRTVLSRYMDIRPKDWRFSKNVYGRPEIDSVAIPEAMDGAQLCFNISHTDGLIAVCTARARQVGIDVENMRQRSAAIEVAGRYFSSIEAAALTQLPKDRQQERFWEYWTFKESYIKARGMGLSIPLNKFSFHYPHEHAVTLSIDPELDDDAARWQFWQFHPAEDYLMALCAERLNNRPPVITVRKSVPFRSEAPFEAALTRTSADPIRTGCS